MFSTEGTYSNIPLYAGAGQCDITKGEQSGNVEITYLDGKVTVEIELLSGFVMTETQLYIGNNDYPEKKQGQNTVETVAPGQYPYNSGTLNNVTTYTFSPSETFSGAIYVIVHAVTCNTREDSNKQTTVKVYPTAFEDLLNVDIKVSNKTRGSISLYSTTGQLIKKANTLNLKEGINKVIIPTSNLNGAMYFLEVKTDSGDKILKKVIAK